MELLVKNIGPEFNSKLLNEEHLTVVRKYFDDQDALPFTHQVEVFNRVSDDENIFLVAGTAAGKTLAISIPLFQKLKEEKINKISFIYPTIALMEDQLKVMRKLLKLYGFEEQVGILKGGMSKNDLIRNLTRKVILTTPDEIYWFFQKNVKFSSLLIYGLCQADEFVLDEAHLFNGLTLQNLKHLFNRIKFLKENYIRSNSVQLHILTATPSDELKGLNKGVEIKGKSKCKDAMVNLILGGLKYEEKNNKFVSAINKSIEQSYNKILVICNSAAFAHRLFSKHASPNRKKIDTLLSKLIESRELAGYFDDFKNDDIDQLDEDIYVADIIFETLSLIFINTKIQLLQRIESTFQEEGTERISGKILSFKLRNDPKLSVWVEFVEFQETNSLDDCKNTIDQQFNSLLINLEFELYQIDRFVRSSNLDDVVKLLNNLYLNKNIIMYLGKKYQVLKGIKSHHRKSFINIYKQERISSTSKLPNVSMWQKSDYPVILYSGSMDKRFRDGLIDIYNSFDKAILLSTSAVEVGVDFSADFLITEQVNSSSLLQRFGRIGRQKTKKKPCAIVFVDGTIYSDFQEKLNGRSELSREEFSEMVTQYFPQNKYLQSSKLIDAIHFKVNQQLGLIGKELNEELFSNKEDIRGLVKQINDAKIELSFGLRGTIPSVTMKDKGIGKDPFYIFRYVGDTEIYSAETPFELARVDCFFNSLIFRRPNYEVMVDYETTYRNAKSIIFLKENQIKISNFQTTRNFLTLLISKHHPENITREISINDEISELSKRMKQSAILLFGDVYLSKWNESFGKDPIRDNIGKPIVIPNQFVLFMLGRDSLKELIELRLDNLEEVYYDIDWDGNSHNDDILVLLDKVQGACFSVYREWINHVN